MTSVSLSGGGFLVRSGNCLRIINKISIYIEGCSPLPKYTIDRLLSRCLQFTPPRNLVKFIHNLILNNSADHQTNLHWLCSSLSNLSLTADY